MENQRRIAWLIPGINAGAGGLRTILKHLETLRNAGYICDLYLHPKSVWMPESQIRENLIAWYGTKVDRIFFGTDFEDGYDLIFATSWDTAEYVADANAPRKAYFVQDYEPWFHSMSSEFLAAQQTYEMGLSSITIGRWLPHQLITAHSANATYVDFCADLDIYHPLAEPRREKAVCAVYQPAKPRRCTTLLTDALRLVKMLEPDTKIYLFGSTDYDGNSLDFDVEKLGIISVEECNALYNSCTVGVCLSATNPSRVPFEMMAAGLPVVDLFQDNNLYDYADGTVMLAEAKPDALAASILNILRDSDRHDALSRAGYHFMQDRPSEREEQDFLKATETILDGSSATIGDTPRSYLGDPLRATDETTSALREIRAEYLRAAIERVVKASRFYRVTLHGLEQTSGIAHVKVAVWSANDQGDLIWYDATRSPGGAYLFSLDMQRHGSLSGCYQMHAYATDTSGTDALLGTSSMIIEQSASSSVPGDTPTSHSGQTRGFHVYPHITFSVEPTTQESQHSSTPKPTKNVGRKGLFGRRR